MLKMAKVENSDETENFVKEHCKKGEYIPTKTREIRVTKRAQKVKVPTCFDLCNPQHRKREPIPLYDVVL